MVPNIPIACTPTQKHSQPLLCSHFVTGVIDHLLLSYNSDQEKAGIDSASCVQDTFTLNNYQGMNYVPALDLLASSCNSSQKSSFRTIKYLQDVFIKAALEGTWILYLEGNWCSIWAA